MWIKWISSIKLVQCLLSKDTFNSATTSQCFVVHEPQREGRREGGRNSKRFDKWVSGERNHHDLHFLHWKALLNHLATDTVFPQRVSAYRANSCYANGSENNICRSESHLQQESAPFLLLSWWHQCEGWAALWAWAPVSFFFLLTECSSSKSTTSPQLKPELSTGNRSRVTGHWIHLKALTPL